MKKTIVTALLCLPFTLCRAESLIKPIVIDKPNTLMREYHSPAQSSAQLFTRHADVKTQIVRISGKIDETDLGCGDVFDTLDAFFNDEISHEHFFYNTVVFCSYNPETENASTLTINSYFEPTDDEGVEILKTYKETHNNQPIFGMPFKIEEAQGLVVSLNVAAGTKDDRISAPFTVLQQDRANYFFKNHQALYTSLIHDIYAHLYSNDPATILPFFKTWVFDFADRVYHRVLLKSNYIEVEPEKIFLMTDEPKVFTSLLRYYYASNCHKYSNHHCL